MNAAPAFFLISPFGSYPYASVAALPAACSNGNGTACEVGCNTTVPTFQTGSNVVPKKNAPFSPRRDALWHCMYRSGPCFWASNSSLSKSGNNLYQVSSGRQTESSATRSQSYGQLDREHGHHRSPRLLGSLRTCSASTVTGRPCWEIRAGSFLVLAKCATLSAGDFVSHGGGAHMIFFFFPH